MILFNIILIQNSALYNSIANKMSFIQLIDSYKCVHLKRSNFIFSKLALGSSVAKTSSSYKAQDQNYKLVSRNFFTKFINQFWQETIFLSVSDQLSEVYMDKLKADGLSIYSNEYKNFLFEFSRALLNGRIQISLNSLESNASKINNIAYIKYVWKKGLNFTWPQKNCYTLSFFQKNNFPNKRQSILIRKLKRNQFPLFTVINNFNQIIVSESSEDILIKKNLIDMLYSSYSKYFLVNPPDKINYQGLFFINPKDAKEYKEYINNQYFNSSESKHLKIFTTKLDFYYKLIRSRVKNIEFRLIPDLVELGEFIYKYQYYNNIHLHSKQYYSKNSFQGQPIYFIEPMLVKNQITKKSELIKYIYPNSEKSNQLNHQVVFMNYKTAILAWQKFKEQVVNYDLPAKPNLIVYNLENFLKQCEDNNQIQQENILFVPSMDSYFCIKNKMKLNTKLNIIQKIINKYSSFKVIGKRMIWSLTSRQPINW